VQIVQLPTQPDAPGVSIDRNTGDTPIVKITGDVKQTIDPEQCSPTSVQLVQLPTQPNVPGVPMDRNTGNPGDQYRPRTPGEEEILRIYEDGINQSSDMMERSGGLWITERILPFCRILPY